MNDYPLDGQTQFETYENARDNQIHPIAEVGETDDGRARWHEIGGSLPEEPTARDQTTKRRKQVQLKRGSALIISTS